MKSLILPMLVFICFSEIGAQELKKIEVNDNVEMNAEVPPDPLEDNHKYEKLPYFPWEIAELRPSDILPNVQLSKDFYSITNRIDTFDFYYKWFLQGIDSTELFVFTSKDSPHTNYRFAIKRKSDWLCLEARTINYLNLSVAKCRKIQNPNNENELILITIDTPEEMQVESKFGGGIHSQLKKVKTVNLLNINTVEFYLHNVLLGYIYNYDVKKQVNGKEIIHNRKAELQYEYSLDSRNKTIAISEKKNFISSVKRSDKKESKSEDVKQDVCAPIQKSGTYKLKGNKFFLID